MSISNTISKIFGGRSATTSPDANVNKQVVYFLVIFDAKTGRLVEQKSFDDADEAMSRFVETERLHRDEDLQVLMFSADSIEAVHATHPHYFRDQPTPSTDPFGFKPIAAAH